MSREIKFRAWDKYWGHWVYFTPSEHFTYHGDVNEDECSWDWSNRHNDAGLDHTRKVKGPFYQFVGLKDKNGKEIYEGDIVKWRVDGFDDNGEGMAQVVYDQPGRYPAFDLYPQISDEWNGFSYLDLEGEVEVIGNIYENPGLLNNKEVQ